MKPSTNKQAFLSKQQGDPLGIALKKLVNRWTAA
tara:strand:- start:1979 stop:2080 length:102 start_codon:yes stop_codon:yes gene_type:complete